MEDLAAFGTHTEDISVANEKKAYSVSIKVCPFYTVITGGMEPL